MHNSASVGVAGETWSVPGCGPPNRGEKDAAKLALHVSYTNHDSALASRLRVHVLEEEVPPARRLVREQSYLGHVVGPYHHLTRAGRKVDGVLVLQDLVHIV